MFNPASGFSGVRSGRAQKKTLPMESGPWLGPEKNSASDGIGTKLSGACGALVDVKAKACVAH